MKEYERVSLDRFDGKNLQSTVYFLSHLHTGKSCPFLHQLEINFCLVLVLVTRQPKLDFLCLICKCFSRDTITNSLPVSDKSNVTSICPYFSRSY